MRHFSVAGQLTAALQFWETGGLMRQTRHTVSNPHLEPAKKESVPLSLTPRERHALLLVLMLFALGCLVRLFRGA